LKTTVNKTMSGRVVQKFDSSSNNSIVPHGTIYKAISTTGPWIAHLPYVGKFYHLLTV